MKFFSWLSCDTQETLWNVYAGKRRAFYVLMPDGNNLAFTDYNGSGLFVDKMGNMVDAFVLIAELNGWISNDDNYEDLRELGMSMHLEPEKYNVMFPLKISFNQSANYFEHPASKNCPDNGYITESLA